MTVKTTSSEFYSEAAATGAIRMENTISSKKTAAKEIY